MRFAFLLLRARQVGRITQAQFRQALTIAGLELTNSEFAALVKRFDTRREGSVDYVQVSGALRSRRLLSRPRSSPLWAGCASATRRAHVHKRARLRALTRAPLAAPFSLAVRAPGGPVRGAHA